jgi:hypothetical protein
MPTTILFHSLLIDILLYSLMSHPEFDTVGKPSNRARIELVPHSIVSLSNGFANGIKFGMTHYQYFFKIM